MNRIIVFFALTILFKNYSFAQNQDTTLVQTKSDQYAYVLIQGRAFSKKLVVQVDIGDTPEQINQGKLYSEFLTDRKSYAAVLNFMSTQKYELINTLDLNESIYGSGGTSGIIFIMKKMTIK